MNVPNAAADDDIEVRLKSRDTTSIKPYFNDPLLRTLVSLRNCSITLSVCCLQSHRIFLTSFSSTSDL